MTAILSSPAPCALSTGEREAWRALAEECCGVYFSDARFHVLESAIRIRQRSLTASEYFELATSSEAERRALWALALNGETSFFRDPDSFAALLQIALPNLMRDRHEDDPVKIWCAGCSTGEEAYSIAGAALPQYPVRVYGSDINGTAIAKARAGVYAALPESLRKRGLQWLKPYVSFGIVNLNNVDEYPRKQDVIWCQNVLIYCREAVKARILAGFEESLRPGGYLLLSAVDAISAGRQRVYRRN